MSKQKILLGAIVTELMLIFTSAVFNTYLCVENMKIIMSLINAVIDVFIIAGILMLLFRICNYPKCKFLSFLPYSLIISAFINYFIPFCFSSVRMETAFSLVPNPSLSALFSFLCYVLSLLSNVIFIYFIIDAMQNDSLRKTNSILNKSSFVQVLGALLFSVFTSIKDCVLFVRKQKFYVNYFIFILVCLAFGLLLELRNWVLTLDFLQE